MYTNNKPIKNNFILIGLFGGGIAKHYLYNMWKAELVLSVQFYIIQNLFVFIHLYKPKKDYLSGVIILIGNQVIK